MWKKKPTDECVLWYDVFIYLFIFRCYWCFLTDFAFAYPWCMMDGERGCCRWSRHIWNLLPMLFSKKWRSFAQRFVSTSLVWREDRESLLLSLNGSCESSLSCFDLLCCCSASEKIPNDYWSSLKMHDTLRFASHERFPDSFANCVHTFCCMRDQDLFWHLWKLIVFWIFVDSAAQFKHIILYFIY